MKKLYCPECGNYLEGGDGELHNCLCGCKQPEVTKSDWADSNGDEIERLRA